VVAPVNHVAPLDDSLIDLIYAALLGETTWIDFLAELSKSLPDGRSSLFYHDISKSKGSWELNFGLESTVEAYARHYSRINPWMPKASVRKVGVGVVAEQMLPAADFKKTEFYNDFLRPLGGQSAVGVTILREGGRSFLLSTLTSRGDPDENRYAADRLTILAPHLRRAFHHFRVGSSQRHIAEIGSSLLDAIDVGFLVVGEGATIKTVSETATRLINNGTCLRVTPLGKIKVCSSEVDVLLQRMLDRAFEGGKVAHAVVNSVKLTFIRVSKDRFSAYFEGPTVVVLIEPVARTYSGFDVIDLAKAYRLTEAETRALRGLVSGRTVNDIADQAMLSRETIRSQIKSLYAKTGVGGQIDLMRLVGRLGDAQIS
jgi:DNA-binding CsgD family transcriptional regulator